MNKIYGLSIALLIGILTSCSIFSPVKSEPQTKYVLDNVPRVHPKKPHRPITLLVAQPETNSAYHTNQIAYRTQPYQIAYYAKHQWVDRPGEMLRPLIVQALQDTHYFHAVITPPSTGHYDYIVNTQIEEVLQDYSHNMPVVRLTVRAEIIRATNYKVIATKQFQIIKPIIQCSPYAGVFVMNQATADMLQQLTQFCLKNIS